MSAYTGLKRRYDELIVLEDFTFSGGSARPIYNYYRHQIATSNKKIKLLRLAYKYSTLKLIYFSLFSKNIIVNGISCFQHWNIILLCYFRKDVIIYLHEAAPHTEPLAKKYPLKFKLFYKLLNKRKVAFVSEWQRQYFLNFASIPMYKIIYNNINFPYVRPSDVNVITIAMIGYQSEIKNISFFSRVADMAANKQLPYEFIWVGGEGSNMKELYHSPHVRWIGDQEHIMDTLNDIDVLLFTSYSDTFGLVLVEAMFKGKRIVSYVENGLATFLTNLKGCRIYDRFDEVLVLNLINDVLKEEVDRQAHKELTYYLCDIGNFEKRLQELLAIPV
ncbi:MAG TPA: glycosyltransferase family 4 protein [Segetibacter sp.]